MQDRRKKGTGNEQAREERKEEGEMKSEEKRKKMAAMKAGKGRLIITSLSHHAMPCNT